MLPMRLISDGLMTRLPDDLSDEWLRPSGKWQYFWQAIETSTQFERLNISKKNQFQLLRVR